MIVKTINPEKKDKALETCGVGERVYVKDIRCMEQTAFRLAALGMTRGTPVEILGKRKNGVMMIRIRGTRYAVGKQIAALIDVSERK